MRAATCLGQVLGCDVKLRLAQDAITPAVLGQSQLGLDSWLYTRPITRDLEDVGYCLQL